LNLTFLRPLYTQPGMVASVYLDATHHTADAARRRRLRWRAADEQLAEAGVDQATRDALGTAVSEHAGTGRHGLAIFASGGRVLAQVSMPDPPGSPVTAWADLPIVAPLLADLCERVHWLRVLADRTGGNMVMSTGEVGVQGTRPPVEVKGVEEYPIGKNKPGGWSSARYQRGAETTWDRNAKQVADAVADAATASGVDVIVLGGDVRGRELVLEHLPVAVAERVVVTDAGSRAPGAETEAMDEVTAEAVRQQAEQLRQQVLDRYRTGRSHGLAATGHGDVRRALDRGRVDTLLIDREVLVPEEFVGLAVGTDAELTIVGVDEERLPDGVGAVLRYADAPVEPGTMAGGAA
jgi:hypothetical protein